MSLGYRAVGGLAVAVVLLTGLVPGAPAVAGAPGAMPGGLSPATADTDLGWAARFHGPGLDTGDSAAGSGGANALAVWDDGTGPALYIGGWTITAGGHEVNRIARWDGADWSPLAGPEGNGVWMAGSGNPSVKALAVYDGDLIVAGFFDRAGGVPVNNIARWDGEQWSPLGEGVTGSIGVQALTVHDGELVAGGYFTTAGGETANRVARWDGEQWSPLGGGIPGGTVFALESFDGELVAGGSFTEAGVTGADRIATWDGEQWAPLGGGMDGTVRSFIVHDGVLVAGGLFTAAGGAAADRIAGWDGTDWSPLGAGMGGPGNPTVLALTGFHGELVAAGSFREAGGAAVNYIAQWDGDQWSPLAGPAGTGTDNGISALAEYQGELFAGSNAFSRAGGVVANYLARWDGTGWSALPGGPATGLASAGSGFGSVTAMTRWRGDLVAAGSFHHAGGERVQHLARWDGATWAPLAGSFGTGANAAVSALAVYQGDLVVAGRFSEAGGLAVNNLARFDGSEWSPLAGPDGAGTDFAVEALAVHDGALIAGGPFSRAGGVAATGIARWDGTQWSAVGTGMNGPVSALAEYDGALIAGGAFTQAGGVAASGVARWDGAGWAGMAGGTDGAVNAFAVHDGALFAGGSFRQASGVTVDRVARFAGVGWSPLVDAGGTGVNRTVHALAGYGGDLYVGGRFTQAGGVAVNQVARWDGSGWSSLPGEGGDGVGGVRTPVVSALHPFDADAAGPVPEKLAVGGTFLVAGGKANWGMAMFGPTAPLAHLSASPPEQDFGAVPAGATAAAQVRLTSTGNTPVEVTGVPAPAPPFAETGGDCPDTPFTLEPGGSCVVGYEFGPAGAGEHEQTVTIGSSGGPVTLTLAGTGLAAPPSMAVDPARLAVEVPAGATGTHPVTVGNHGEADLDWEVLDRSFEGAGPSLPGLTPGDESASGDEPAPGGDSDAAGGGEVGRGGNEPARFPGGPAAGATSTPRQPDGAGGAVPGGAAPGGPLAAVDTVTHSESMEVQPGHAITCVNLATGHSRGSQFLRTFELSEFGIHDDFLVTDVTVGVQLANPDVDATVNLYTLEGALQYGNLEPLGSQTVTVGPEQDGRLVTVPVRSVVPGGATLVVELATADLLGTGWFYPGTNGDGESAPSYFASDTCGYPEPTPLAEVGTGFPDIHLVMAVSGRDPVDCQRPDWLAVDPASGTTAGGASSEVAVSFDTAGLELGEYQTLLCLDSNDPAGGLTVVPVTLTVVEDDDPPAEPVCDRTVTGVHDGPLTVDGGVTCLAAGAQVLGEVNVGDGAGLVSTAAVVQGPVSAVGAAVVELSFTQVTGPVLISGTSESVSLFANQVTGSVNLVGSGTGESPVTVSGNTVIGSLACFGNDPAPVDQGLPNTATAGKLGQCAQL